MLEETGCAARIQASIPGDFAGDNSLNHYFLMAEVNPGAPLVADDGDTSQVRWVTFDAAKALLQTTPNFQGRARDQAVLEAARVLVERQEQA